MRVELTIDPRLVIRSKCAAVRRRISFSKLTEIALTALLKPYAPRFPRT